jgi:hypothetical protein
VGQWIVSAIAVTVVLLHHIFDFHLEWQLVWWGICNLELWELMMSEKHYLLLATNHDDLFFIGICFVLFIFYDEC